MSIHTLPEDGYAAVDFFTCGANSPEEAETLIQQELECKSSEKMLLKRRPIISKEYHDKEEHH